MSLPPPGRFASDRLGKGKIIALHPNKEQQQEVMKLNSKKTWNTRTLVGLALFTAIVVVLQLLGNFIRFGIFSISLVLVPIVVGAALYGPAAGGWLGGVFGLVVLLTGGGEPFMTINPVGTIVTVMVKGIAAGLAAGFVYKLLERKNQYVAIILSAIVCPVVNTGIFLLGCLAFFMETIRGWAGEMGYANAGAYMIFGLAGLNFVIELAVNIVLSPVIRLIIKLGQMGVAKIKGKKAVG